MDKFCVDVIAATPNPQQTVWAAMHQDYSEQYVLDTREKWPDEQRAGELIVKHLLAGDRGHYGCYDAETEVLTSGGWVYWPDVQNWHNLAAIDIQTQEVKFEVPIALQKYKHVGQIYKLQGQQLDTAVTLDHRMVVKRRRKDGTWTNPYFEQAADVLGKPRRYLKSGFLVNSERSGWKNPWGIPPVDFAKLVGFFVGDGMKPRPADQIRFRLIISRKIDFLYSLGIPIEKKAGDRYTINFSGIGQWFLDKCYSVNGEKCLPEGYLTLSPQEVEGLLEGLKNSDGNIQPSNWRYASTSIYLLDQLQALLHLNNLSGNWSLSHEENEQHKASYYIHISDRNSPRVEISQATRSRTYSESLELYDGFVYCATVSTGALIIRRNRKVMVSGNCLEHPQITFNVGYFPHSMMQQIRTHRVGVSFDVQCLAADAEVTFVNASGTLRKIKIAELYDLWAKGEKAIRERQIKGRNGEPPGNYRRDCKSRLQKMNLRVLNEDTGIFEIGHIQEVFEQGIQPVYRLTLEDGRTLDCTENHRLLTNKGWQTMGEALLLVTDAKREVLSYKNDCHLMTNGVIVGEGLYRDKNWLREQLSASLTARQMAQKADCSVETIKKWVYLHELKLNKCKPGTKNPWNKGLRGAYHLNITPEQRQQRRERSKQFTRRGEDSNFWKGGVTEERVAIGAWTRTIAPQVHEKYDFTCQRCSCRGNQLHAHHLLPVYSHPEKAYDFDNLVTVCETCHRQIHSQGLELEFAQNFVPVEKLAQKPKPKGRKLSSHPMKVVRVQYLGLQRTYDLEVAGKWHNFVANGVVVHNSFRYTGQRIINVALGQQDVEEVFYLRPVGKYTNRQGKRYFYSEEQRAEDLKWCVDACQHYQKRIEEGLSEEHARGLIPFDARQHFVLSCNLRSLMHLLDLRWKKDAQLEAQKFCELLYVHLENWCPSVAQWYLENRAKKAKLSP